MVYASPAPVRALRGGPLAAKCTATWVASGAFTDANLSRLRKGNADLCRTLALYEETIRQLALENDALRSGGTVLPLPNRSTPAPPGPS